MYDFATVEKPAVTREGKPNPFMDAVKSLVSEDGKPLDKAIAFPIADVKSKDDKKIKTAQRQLRECGKPLNVTVRQTVALDTPKKGTATVTFWTVDRITHSDAQGNA